ncbi:hypothetical protein J2Z48_001244 [Croceifilum oryzae]|uniref:Uncharacterized protein n=1 Tax=Croceifilum oryzae TaxID=1553429 RepID=A0AAJ1WQ16_9BACL|nr:hypothetical protein [Croceifilum oryzae]
MKKKTQRQSLLEDSAFGFSLRLQQLLATASYF